MEVRSWPSLKSLKKFPFPRYKQDSRFGNRVVPFSAMMKVLRSYRKATLFPNWENPDFIFFPSTNDLYFLIDA